MDESTMTIKELANVAGVSHDAIWRTSKKLFPSVFSRGKTTRFTGSQCVEIMNNVRKRNMVSKHTQSAKELTQSAKVDYVTKSEIAGIITEVLKQVLPLVQNQPKKEPLKIEAPKMTPRAHIRKTVNEYVAKTGANHRDAYISLYKEYGYRVGGNVTLCAKNRGMKTIDYIEEIGQLKVLEAIAVDYFSD